MAQKKFPFHPARPELQCWGCDKYCAASDMLCGNGSDRTQHPYELFGEDWQCWGSDFKAPGSLQCPPPCAPSDKPMQTTSSAMPLFFGIAPREIV